MNDPVPIHEEVIRIFIEVFRSKSKPILKKEWAFVF
jgi:hypothetical protein